MFRSPSPNLRRLLIRYFSSSSSSFSPSPPFSTSHPLKTHSPKSPLSLPHFTPIKTLASLPSKPKSTDEQIAQLLSTHLLKSETNDNPDEPTKPSLTLHQRLDLYFSNISFSPELLLQTLNLSPSAGRQILSFYHWLSKHPNSFKPDDDSLRHFIEHLGRNKDFKAIQELLVQNRGIAGEKCFKASIDRLVRAGRPTQAISFFDNMEKDYGFARDRGALLVVVSALCDHGFASHAERLVKRVADAFFPDESICEILVRGWCVDGKIDEARRLVGEILRGGFELGTSAYNSLLDCVCRICRKKDPFRLQTEADKVLVEMDIAGIPRDTGTFNVLITNLCKIRKTEDALKLFERMGEWGCSPNAETFVVLTRSLYQAARTSEGDAMIDRMKSTGFGEALDKKKYYGFIKILCGIERVDHAMKVFTRMKKDGCTPGIKTYKLLIGKLAAHGKAARANALFFAAVNNGVPVTPEVYKVDPRFVKKPEKKKEKKRETLPEKMARKRKRLRKLRLSFVKKPKKGMRMAY
ncbi:pentatricopeptide repeat (PPR) superfamily protein [Tasmannia lanceolata]|uniref:pentatricopeptide repeat (PPR) superfamily protein n=1 Tax=Tasmannia lanceolata TaxID=3420 RepID=UPI0040649A40